MHTLAEIGKSTWEPNGVGMALPLWVFKVVFSKQLQVKSYPHPLLGCSHLPSLWLHFFQGEEISLGAIQAVGCKGASLATASEFRNIVGDQPRNLHTQSPSQPCQRETSFMGLTWQFILFSNYHLLLCPGVNFLFLSMALLGKDPGALFPEQN